MNVELRYKFSEDDFLILCLKNLERKKLQFLKTYMKLLATFLVLLIQYR